jgi:hypothetical protein
LNSRAIFEARGDGAEYTNYISMGWYGDSRQPYSGNGAFVSDETMSYAVVNPAGSHKFYVSDSFNTSTVSTNQKNVFNINYNEVETLKPIEFINPTTPGLDFRFAWSGGLMEAQYFTGGAWTTSVIYTP